ncbi:hypothetical protein B5X24_HaOG213046 [Helicoverpa armigera]|nr:hypothetical protein B5X24_HaOG213046 [Helicoverpa armigera]
MNRNNRGNIGQSIGRRSYIPTVDRCCGCVSDLKTATAIIAVLGVVTSPAVSWAVVRHSFVIRVSCYVTTSAVRPDVVDINLNNMLSFGFGANAGLGPSCLGPKNYTAVQKNVMKGSNTSSTYVNLVRWLGWAVLLADIVFIVFSLHYLYRLFRPPSNPAAVRFMISCVVALLLSFIYGMLYVGACMSVGGSFPVFEFLFCLIDIITYATWIYLLQFVWYHLQNEKVPPPLTRIQELQETLELYSRTHLWEESKREKDKLPLGTI